MESMPISTIRYDTAELTAGNVFGQDTEQEISGYPIHKLDLLYNGENYSLCTENIRRVLERHPEFKDCIRFDKWTRKKEYKDGDTWREITDSDVISVQNRIATLYHQLRRLTKQSVQDAIEVRFQETSYDSALDYLNVLKWDGVARVDTWITQTYHTQNDEYHSKVGSVWLKGLVKRVMEPGCKFDYMLVLEGAQGIKKSTSLEILGNDKWHVPTNIRITNKDSVMILEGKMIVEFSEGSTMNMAENSELKSFITIRTDTIRRPYSRYVEDIPRRCVFAMSTNDAQYLKDDTGNRRYLPIEVTGEADIEWLRENRDQLFAEAVHRVRAGENVWEIPFAEAEKKQMSRLISSPYEDMISDWLSNPKIYEEIVGGFLNIDIESNGITISEVWVHALNGVKNRLTTREEMMVARALRKLGLEKVRMSVNGVQKMRWMYVKK